MCSVVKLTRRQWLSMEPLTQHNPLTFSLSTTAMASVTPSLRWRAIQGKDVHDPLVFGTADEEDEIRKKLDLSNDHLMLL